ncbi:hypothetical protein Leryth_002563 [Lithospermum erythrorhizon]|nr:hypothetical protein Leryth_002563 [Lithospermum erythrorhizon]
MREILLQNMTKLINLPCCPSVDDILAKYLDYTSKDVIIGTSMQEILNGMQCYFNKALPIYLLYKQERLQFSKAVSDNGSPSRIYGAEHLLRLFVMLPKLLTFVNIKEDTLIALRKLVLNFLKFLQKNWDTLFVCGAYDDPTDSEGSSEGIDNCQDSVHLDQTHP